MSSSILENGDRVKVYLDYKVFGKEVYLGKGTVSGRIVYDSQTADYSVEFDGFKKIIFGLSRTEKGVRCFRIKKIGGNRGSIEGRVKQVHKGSGIRARGQRNNSKRDKKGVASRKHSHMAAN